MRKSILASFIVSALICGTAVSCTVTTYESTTPRSAKWTTDVKTEAKTEQAGQDNNADAPAAENNNAGNNAQNNSVQQIQVQAVTDVPQVKAAETPAAQQQPKADPPAATAEPQQQAANYMDYIPYSRTVMSNLDAIDVVAGGYNVSTDDSDMELDGAYTYHRVTDSHFSSMDDVRNFADNAVCGDLIYRYSCLYSGDVPMFKEFNGALYYLSNARGCGFGYQGDPTVTNATGGSFTFSVPVMYYNELKSLVVDAVNDGGVWKACSFNYV